MKMVLGVMRSEMSMHLSPKETKCLMGTVLRQSMVCSQDCFVQSENLFLIEVVPVKLLTCCFL